MLAAMPFNLDLSRPLLLIGLLAIPWLVYWWRQSLVDLTHWQRMFSLGMRSLLVLCLVFSLAGLNLVRPTWRQCVIVALDRSASIGQQAREVTDTYLQQLGKAARGQPVMWMEFARQPETIQPLESFSSTSNTTRSEGGDADSSERLATNLESALEVAAAAIPPTYAPHVLLLSDGHATEGDVMRAVLASEVPISTVPLPAPDDPEVQMAQVQVPATVREGEPFFLELVINSNRAGAARIEIFRDGVRVNTEATEVVELTPGENRFRIPQQVVDLRQALFTAQVSSAADTRLDNNRANAVVVTSGRPRILLSDSDLSQTDALRWALEEQSIQVDLRPVEGIPASLAELQQFDAVVLSNVPATDFTPQQMDSLRSYVQDLGGGLVMLGGDQSFGLGGYYGSPLEEILPVRTDFEKEEEKPSLALLLLIDRSGSMGGQKIELAKDAARAAVELLGPQDQIGVIAFDDESYWVSPLHPAADKQFVLQRIGTMVAGGGTNIYPAMSDAFDALQKAVARLKHLIVLTDGISAPGDFGGITADMAAAQITVSTVGVGEGADQQLLQQMARQGRGRYYFCDDPQSIPQVFVKETVTASKSALNETPFVPLQIQSTPVLSSIDLQAAPVLLGFVATRPKPTSEVILVTESGEPLLAWWRYGLGVSLAFTSDASSRWAAEWLTWSDFPLFWAQCVRHVLRNSAALGADVQIQPMGEETNVQVDLLDEQGELRSAADVQLTVMRPSAQEERQELDLSQTAPGRYTAQIATQNPGAYFLELAVRGTTGPPLRQSRALFVGYPDELQLKPTDETLLRRIATESGGRFNPTPEQVFQPLRPAEMVEPLWPYLLATALVLLVLDVALRRIDLSGGR